MIQATGIRKSFGSLEVLKGIDLHIVKREIVRQKISKNGLQP